MGAERLGGSLLKRGEIRWYTFRLPDKRRPVLILTRNEIIDQLNEIIVVPATRTIRGLTSEVILTAADGMPTSCALNFDHVALAQRSRIGALVCTLSGSKMARGASGTAGRMWIRDRGGWLTTGWRRRRET